MCELISRSAAIDAVNGMPDCPNGYSDTYDKAHIIAVLEDVPSVQPDDAALHESCTNCPLYDHDRHNCPRFNRVIPATIEAAKTRWIPVTEKLPERGKEVLVTRDYDGRKDHHKSCRYVETASRYGEDDDVVWSSYSDEYKMHPKSHRVVAWMPLPPVYEGRQDE